MESRKTGWEIYFKISSESGKVALTCNPRVKEVEAGRWLLVQGLSGLYHVKHYLKKTFLKIKEQRKAHPPQNIKGSEKRKKKKKGLLQS